MSYQFLPSQDFKVKGNYVDCTSQLYTFGAIEVLKTGLVCCTCG